MIKVKAYEDGDIKKDYVRVNIEDRGIVDYKIDTVLNKYKEEDGWYLYGKVEVSRVIGGNYNLRIPLAQCKKKILKKRK